MTEEEKQKTEASEEKLEEKVEKVQEKKEEKVEEPKESSEEIKDDKKIEEKKVEKPKQKKTETVVNSHSLPISTKHSVAVCKFIKNKKIENAMADLQEVINKKIAVPMKGEIPHRKGKIMSGRYPKNAAKHFIKLLKTLTANANVNGLNNPVISEAIANIAQRPRGKAGRVKRKRTHVKIVAKEKSSKGEKKK